MGKPSASSSVTTSKTIGLGGGTLDASASQAIGGLDGAPMPRQLNDEFSSRFGTSLDHLSLATGLRAQKLAESMYARAFSYGNTIGFAAGAYQPSSASGRRLIAHEVAHSLEARGGSAPVVRRAIDFEKKAADATARNLDAGKLSDTSSLFTVFTSGMSSFLALDPEFDAKHGYSLVSASDAKNYAEVEGTIRRNFGTPKTMLGPDETPRMVSADLAVDTWKDVRQKVRDAISAGVDVVKGSNPLGGIGVSHGDISVNPKLLDDLLIRKSSGFDLFWVLLHEILHTQGMNDATIGSGLYAENKTHKRERNLHGSKTNETTTTLGEVVYTLNVVRAGLGLPVRTNYSDPTQPNGQPAASAITFSDSAEVGALEYYGAMYTKDGASDADVASQAGNLSIPSDYSFNAKEHREARKQRGATHRLTVLGKALSPGVKFEWIRKETTEGTQTDKRPSVKASISIDGSISFSGKYKFGKTRGEVSGGMIDVIWKPEARVFDSSDVAGFTIRFDWSEGETTGVGELFISNEGDDLVYFTAGVPLTVEKGHWHVGDGPAEASLQARLAKET